MKLDNYFAAVSENKTIKAIRQGLLLIMPLIMVGSFVLMILNLPFNGINDLFTTLFKGHWRDVALAIHRGTFRIMSMSLVLSIAYVVAKEDEAVRTGGLNTIAVVLTVFSCYVAYDAATETVINENATGPTGMFHAIVITLLSARLFLFFYHRLPRKRRTYAYDADSILMMSLYNVLPTLLTIGCFALARTMINMIGIGALTDKMLQGTKGLFMSTGGGLITAILYALLTHVMWFVGIHGTNVMEGVSAELFVSASEVNIALAEASQAPTQIITKEFLDNFVFIGGAGCTLGLLVALFLAGRRTNAGGLAWYALAPGVFGINEQIIYGLPIIFNPYYLVPFLLTPAVLSVTSYIAFAAGFVPLTTMRVVWTTPVLVSGFFSTGSWAGVILQLINMAVAVGIYLPFVYLHEKHLAQTNHRFFTDLMREYNEAPYGCSPNAISRGGETGMIARALARELRGGLQEGEAMPLHMEYQPKIGLGGNVVGAEALLRWAHPVYGNISPLLALGLCDEIGLTNQLGTWVMETSFAEMNRWKTLGHGNLSMSVNLAPLQIKEDDKLVSVVAEMIRKYNLNPALMELELTEHAAVDQSFTTRRRLAQIKDMGVNISIDDFGMGNSSLLYLRDYYANVVKIDISLVRSCNTNTQSQEIIRSIISLCNQLDVLVVAEGVETAEQLGALRKLGCEVFQGWYFSRALHGDDLLAFVELSGKFNKTVS